MPVPQTPSTAANDALRLAELLAARLCHELAGPIGALAGTLELAIEDADDAGFALALEQAVATAARLRLLRAAWGLPGEPLDVAGLRELLAGRPRAARVHLDLDGLDSTTAYSPHVARLLLNVVLLATEGLPHGGTIVVAQPASDQLVVQLRGSRAASPARFTAMLDDAATGSADTREIQAVLTTLMARNAGIALTLPPGHEAVRLLIGLRAPTCQYPLSTSRGSRP